MRFLPGRSWSVQRARPGVPGEGGAAFHRLARSSEGWGEMQLQNIWLGDFNERFIATEPRPLCAFLSGNFIDWCQQRPRPLAGTAAILRGGSLPIWASCGGAQGLAILAETGVEHPWDCPQCRDPENPRLPIYTHIAGSVRRKCGDYSGCVFERGPFTIRQLSPDPGLPRPARRVSRDGKPLRPDRMGPQGLGADRRPAARGARRRPSASGSRTTPSTPRSSTSRCRARPSPRSGSWRTSSP